MSELHDDPAPETGATTLVRTAQPKPKHQTQTRRQPPYHVVILNDEEHTFDYVIELLSKIFGHARATAEALTWRIHVRGREVVFTTHKELAELKREQVLAYGPDPRLPTSTGSLACYIEPAPCD
jgi:ATP-dependent Clp protease adaptor protein ClpS